MLPETKILFENIKSFRHLITEAVSQGDMVKYIQNHEYIYIFYAGDGKNKRGWRTIRPYVLGISASKAANPENSTAGNLVIRAWQDKGKSVSYSKRRRGEKHDFWIDDSDNREKPGWRMFRLDKIEQLLPIGERFQNDDGSVMIPPDYHEGGDKDMSSIIAYVSTKKRPDVQPTGELTPPTAGKKKYDWGQFSRGNKNSKKITAYDITNLRRRVRDVYKERIGDFLVAINNKNEFKLIRAKDKDKVPELAIVGTLPNLYDTLVKANAPADTKFFDAGRNKAKMEREKTKPEIKESDLPTIPFERKPFFKQ